MFFILPPHQADAKRSSNLPGFGKEIAAYPQHLQQTQAGVTFSYLELPKEESGAARLLFCVKTAIGF
jgi:hypothetical protein